MKPPILKHEKKQFFYPELVTKYILTPNLASYDPYDIWKTSLGSFIKKKFYTNNKGIFLLAGGLSVYDLFINNKSRLFYKRQEFPIVRAFASLLLNNLYRLEEKTDFLAFSKKNIDWLIANAKKTETGIGWGLGFYHPASDKIIYSPDAALSTMTPYIVEALLDQEKILSKEGLYKDTLEKVFNFFNSDIKVLDETETYEITSYGTFPDRKVVNAVSYTLYSLLLLNNYFKGALPYKLHPEKLYNYIAKMQNQDGSWYYSEEGSPFIDCFHSCIVLKNLIKSRPYMHIDGNMIEKGYSYIKNNLWDNEKKMYKRFSITNKPGLIKYDLYNNAEMLNLAILMNDKQEADKIVTSIQQNFIDPSGIFSAIDILGFKRNKNMLRWAILPCLYALSNYNLKYNSPN